MEAPTRSPQRSEQRSEQRIPITEGRLERPTSNGRTPDIFWFDKANQPPDMAYQWIVVTILGQENKQHMIEMARYHWRPVPASRHPEITGTEGGDAPIVIGGQMLMERPQYLSDESREEERRAANGQVASQLARVGNDMNIGSAFEKQRPMVERSVGRAQLVDDK